MSNYVKNPKDIYYDVFHKHKSYPVPSSQKEKFNKRYYKKFKIDVYSKFSQEEWKKLYKNNPAIDVIFIETKTGYTTTYLLEEDGRISRITI